MKIVSNSLQRDNQKRLFEALCRISDENSEQRTIDQVSHLMPDHSGFFPAIPALSQAQLATSNNAADLCVESDFSLSAYGHSDTALAYDAAASALADVPLQVDHCGTRIVESLSCAWIPKPVLSDTSWSGSASACSYTDQGSQLQTANATVFAAAAVTAAMIVDRAESAAKRPRSSTVDAEDDDSEDDCHETTENCKDADDNATEASLDESECALDCIVSSHDMNKSPKAVQDFPQFSLKPTTVHRACNLLDSCSKPASIDQDLATELINKPIDDPSNPPVDFMSLADAPNQDSVLPQVSAGVDTQRSPMLSRKRRAEAMERFRKKKAVRCFGRKVRYQVRKRIATTRPRVNGRFARLADAEVHAPSTRD